MTKKAKIDKSDLEGKITSKTYFKPVKGKADLDEKKQSKTKLKNFKKTLDSPKKVG